MCPAVSTEFAATVCVQRLIYGTAAHYAVSSWTAPGSALQTHSASKGELISSEVGLLWVR